MKQFREKDFTQYLLLIIVIIWAAAWQNQQNGMCAQRGLGSAWASTQSDQSLLSAWRKLRSLATHWAYSEHSDQTGRMPRLIWVFAGCTSHFVGFVMRRLIFCLHFKDQNTNEEWQHKKDIYISQTVDNHELCNLLYLQKRFHVPQFTNGLQRQLLVDMDFSPLRTWVAFGV